MPVGDGAALDLDVDVDVDAIDDAIVMGPVGNGTRDPNNAALTVPMANVSVAPSLCRYYE